MIGNTVAAPCFKITNEHFRGKSEPFVILVHYSPSLIDYLFNFVEACKVSNGER